MSELSDQSVTEEDHQILNQLANLQDSAKKLIEVKGELFDSLEDVLAPNQPVGSDQSDEVEAQPELCPLANELRTLNTLIQGTIKALQELDHRVRI